jgi:hypothetical protein
MAERHFNDTKEHKRCKDWQPHERCIKPRASGNRHYRLEKHNDGEYYDVCLYSTVMARYYRPDENGHRRVLYAGHGTQTSKSFQSRVLGVWEGGTRVTTENKQVVVPLYRNNVFHDGNGRDMFSVDMVLDEKERLIVERSRHAPHFTHKSSADDKAKRKAIKEHFSTFVMLAQLRLPEFRDNVSLMRHMGQPFGGGNINFNERMSVESMWEGGDVIEEHWMNHFFDLCQDVYDTIASKRGYEQSGFHLGSRWGQNLNISSIDTLEKQVTEKDLEKGILARVFRILCANERSEAVPQPMFMGVDEYPRSTITPWSS